MVPAASEFSVSSTNLCASAARAAAFLRKDEIVAATRSHVQDASGLCGTRRSGVLLRSLLLPHFPMSMTLKK
jgi:hypothetical protein